VLLVLFINFSKNSSFLILLRFKSGCKDKGFILNCQMFWEVFFNARLLFPSLSVRKGKKRQPKALALRIGLQR
ncbi:hypothetical protein ACIXHP_21550, partial [Bacteroides fragilis]